MIRTSSIVLLLATCLCLIGCGDSESSSTPEPFTFGVVADVQYADIPHRDTRRYSEAADKLGDAITMFNAVRNDFVMEMGDIIDEQLDENGEILLGPDGDPDAAHLDVVMSKFNALRGKLYHVLGNHDFDAKPWAYEDCIPLSSFPGGQYYYEFIHKGIQFIVLDGNDVSVRHKPESRNYQKAMWYIDTARENGIHLKTWNGAVGELQLKWFRQKLAEGRDRGLNTIVCCHFPIHLDATKDREPIVLWNREDVLTILDEYPNVVAYLAGHEHNGGYVFHNGVHHVTFQAICDAPADSNAYALVDVKLDRISIRGFGTIPSRELPFRAPPIEEPIATEDSPGPNE